MSLRDWPLWLRSGAYLWSGPFLRNWPYLLGRVCLRDRSLRLGSWAHLRGGAFVRSWLHGLHRMLLRCGPHLLSRCCLLHRRFLDSPLNRGPGLLALLHRDRNWLTPFHGERLGHDDRLRLAAVYRDKLGAVAAGGNLVLLLNSQRWQTRLPQGSQFRSTWWKIHATTTAAITHAVVGSDIGYVANVCIVDDSDVDVRDLAVVVELVVVPIPTVVAAADVAVSVVHPAVVANVAAPISSVPAVAIGIVAPIARRP